MTNTTINNITVISETYVRNTRFVNQHVAGGVTVVPQDAFVNSRSVSRAALRVPAKALDDAEVLHQVSVAPSQRSVLGAATPAALRVPPERIQNRPVVARATPAPASVQDVRKFNPRDFNTLGDDARPGSPARSAFVPQTALVRPAAPANPPAAITPVRPGITVRPGVGDANPMERRFSPRELELQHDKPQPGVRGGVQERISEERIHPTRPTRPDDAPRNLDRPAPHSVEKPASPPAPRSVEPQRPARPERPPQADRPSESNRPPFGARL